MGGGSGREKGKEGRIHAWQTFCLSEHEVGERQRRRLEEEKLEDCQHNRMRKLMGGRGLAESEQK